MSAWMLFLLNLQHQENLQDRHGHCGGGFLTWKTTTTRKGKSSTTVCTATSSSIAFHAPRITVQHWNCGDRNERSHNMCGYSKSTSVCYREGKQDRVYSSFSKLRQVEGKYTQKDIYNYHKFFNIGSPKNNSSTRRCYIVIIRWDKLRGSQKALQLERNLAWVLHGLKMKSWAVLGNMY